jgi:hypothetical protein
MAEITAPKYGDQFAVGDERIYVIRVEHESGDDEQRRTVVIGHDDYGNEVEVRFFPRGIGDTSDTGAADRERII